jgi:nucleotide-binding universal stress UspA family protein
MDWRLRGIRASREDVDTRRRVMIKTILIATDGSPTAKTAAAYAAGIAKCEGSKVVVLSVLHTHLYGDTTAYGDTERVIAEMRATVNGQVEELRRAGIEATGRTWETDTDEVQTAIEHVAEEIGADLLVMGTHGRTGLDRALLGSVADRVLRMTRVPVLVIPKTYAAAHARARVSTSERTAGTPA